MNLTALFRAVRDDPSAENVEALLLALRKALRSRLRRLRLLDQPPQYVDYPEFRTWDEALPRDELHTDVLHDCYAEAIQKRFVALSVQLEFRDNIDGLILLNIDRFILARQKKEDPVGYATFKNLEAAVEALAAAGRVEVADRVNGKLRNSSEVRFAGAAGPPASPDRIEAALGDPAWDRVLNRLARIGTTAQERLREALERLPAAGVRAFRVLDLIGTLKVLVREAHEARNRPPGHEVVADTDADGQVRELIRIVPADAPYSEEAEHARNLLERVRAAIAVDADLQERTRAGMLALLDELLRYTDRGGEIPAWSELARLMGCPRATFWDHLKRLRDLARREAGGDE